MRSRAIAFILLIPFAIVGCGRESAAPTSPAGPRALATDAAPSGVGSSKLDALWPNDDGRSWSYSHRWDDLVGAEPQIYATPDEVPPAPSPKQLLPLLRLGMGSATPQQGVYGLRFDGQITTSLGVTAQNLVESLEPVGGPARVGTVSFRDRLLFRIAQARPDLRARLGVASLPSEFVQTWPLLVHGGAWEKTDQYIGTYGEVDRLLAWKFLDADTRPGSSFRFQLLPSVVDDAFLEAWIVPQRLRTGSSRGQRVEVVYVIDYGVSSQVDANGNPNGYFRGIGYGSVTYVPGKGPVESLERPLAFVEHPERPWGQISLTLRPSASAIAGLLNP